VKRRRYGPAGVAVIVECLTDNKNRTAGDIRSFFTKGGGSLGETNSVSFMFERKGVIDVKAGPAEDAVMEAALEAGAEDVVNHGEGGLEVRCDFTALFDVAAALSKSFALGESKVRFLALNGLKVEGDAAKKVLKLLDTLEDCDDVQNVYSNAEFDDADLA
jgi:YebC/PmpR family DNA-binding regulatory protein